MKSNQIGIRITDNEREVLEMATSASGCQTLSEYIRIVALTDAAQLGFAVSEESLLADRRSFYWRSKKVNG